MFRLGQLFFKSDCNSTLWETFNLGYTLISGSSNLNSCSIPTDTTETKTAKALVTATKTIAGATLWIVTVMSISKTSSSLIYFWSMTNQLQMFNLFFLTRSFLPDSIQLTIKGSLFALNLYEYIPIRRIDFYQSLFSDFNLGLTDSQLDPFEIKSDSTVFNVYPILTAFLMLTIFHFCISMIQCLLSKCSRNRDWQEWVNLATKLTIKIKNVMTFGVYIRNLLELSQFMLISAIYEIYI